MNPLDALSSVQRVPRVGQLKLQVGTTERNFNVWLSQPKLQISPDLDTFQLQEHIQAYE